MLNLGIPDSFSKLNLIGVISLFGGEIALSALRYNALLKNVSLSLYFATVLSPGLQVVSLKMFKQMGDGLSKAISGGGARADGKEIMGLSLNANYKYIGLHSGTNMTVASILGDTLIRKCKDKSVVEIPSTRRSPQNRNLNLKVIKLSNMSGEKGSKYNFHVHVDHDPHCYRNVLLYTMPLLTIMGMALLLSLQNRMVFYLVLSNIISNMSVAFVARGSGFGSMNVKVADNSPIGDIFIEDGANMYLVIGEENVIQYAFQNPVIVYDNSDNIIWKLLQIPAAYVSYLMVIANIMLLPFSSVDGQVIFGCLIFFGIVQNIILSTFDRDEMLLKVTENAFTIESTQEYIFQTRSSAIAFCILKSKVEGIQPIRHLLPNTEIYDEWFENVINIVRNPTSIIPRGDGLLDDLNRDLQDALTAYRTA
jgi:hypothetical protein